MPDKIQHPTEVIGKGNPDVDVPAVQSAVDQGGNIVLRGHFSFDRAPTTPAGETYSRMVTITKEITLAGGTEKDGELPIIEGGNWPFLVNAPGAVVAIQGLHFVRPKSGAIWVYAAGGLSITGCRIEGPQPTAEQGALAGQTSPASVGILVTADPHPPSTANPGKPENFSGTLTIADNDIDMAGTSGAPSLGIIVFAVGKPPHQVDVDVSRNHIRNVSAPAINFQLIGGQAHAEANVLTTGSVAGATTNPDVVRVIGSGSYVIEHNVIECGWADGTASGIRVTGQQPPLPPAINAIVTANDVTMSAPDGTSFAQNSAGIEIKGFARGNLVLNNRIRGHAGTAMAVIGPGGGTPAGTMLVGNDFQDFQASLAGILVGTGVSNTVIVSRQTDVQDHGTSTIVIAIP
jgi:hypothetical protein